MNSKTKANKKLIKILVELARVIVGFTFIFSGLSKAIDPMGSAIKIAEYLNSFSWPGADTISLTMGMLLSSFEFLLGAFIIMGIYRRSTAILSFAFMTFMLPLTLYIAIFNPVADCGCFGEALSISNWETFFKNIVLMAAVTILLRWPRKQTHLFSRMGRWIPAGLALAGIIVFTIGNYRHLPIYDFRPYKIGASLQELTQTPEGAAQDEIEYSFVYEKEGKRQSFGLDNLPDESWTYIERSEKLIKEGYRAPVSDFIVLDGEIDRTEELINQKGITLLLIAPNWSKARINKIDQIDALYEYAQQNGINFYGLSSSSSAELETWRFESGADYPTLFVDASVAQTIIRGNPGLVILKDGVIRAKVNDTDFPKIDQVEAFVKKHTGSEIAKSPRYGRTTLLKAWAAFCIFGLLQLILLRFFPSLSLLHVKRKKNEDIH